MRPCIVICGTFLVIAELLVASYVSAQVKAPAAPSPRSATPQPLSSEPQSAQAGPKHQDRDVLLIKTAYLYNFVKFVRWPDQPPAEIKLCITRDAALAHAAQDALRDKHVGTIAVRVYGPRHQAGACHVRYGARGAPGSGQPGELTVGEGRAFVDNGGMIAFVIVDDRVRFLVNLKALREAGLSADARLATAALEVLQ